MKSKPLIMISLLSLFIAGCKQDIRLTDPLTSDDPTATESTVEDTEAEEEKQNEPRPTPGILLVNNINTLNPNAVADIDTASALNMAGEGLYRQTREGNYRLGILASEPEKQDAHTWRFKIKDEARWSDGAPVVVDDVIYSWQALLNSNNTQPNAHLLDNIVTNADKITSGDMSVEELGIKKVDDMTFDVIFDTEIATMDDVKPLLSRVELYPLPTHYIDNDYKKYGESSQRTLSNGPYVINGWKAKASDQWTFNQNPYYDDKESYSQANINATVTNDLAMIPTYLSHQMVDIVPNLKAESPVDTTHYLQFNIQDVPGGENVLEDKEMRQLLLRAINRQEAVNNLDEDVVPADRLTPHDNSEISDDVNADTDKFNQLLDAYNYDALELTMLTTRDQRDIQYSEEIKGQLETAFPRLTVNLVPSSNEYVVSRSIGRQTPSPKMLGYHYDMVILNHRRYTENDDYSFYQNYLADKNVVMYGGDTLPNIIKDYNAANARMSGDAVSQAEEAVQADQLILPLFYTMQSYDIEPSVSGEVSSTAGYLYDFEGIDYTPSDNTIPIDMDSNNSD